MRWHQGPGRKNRKTGITQKRRADFLICYVKSSTIQNENKRHSHLAPQSSIFGYICSWATDGSAGSLFYITIKKNQKKSSRAFLGYAHLKLRMDTLCGTETIVTFNLAKLRLAMLWPISFTESKLLQKLMTSKFTHELLVQNSCS